MFRNFLTLFNRQTKIKTRWLSIILPMFILGIFLVLLTFNNVYTETYDIERFNRAKETIRSPITIENEAETDRKMRETIQAVENRYNISEDITEERIEYVVEIFEAIHKLETEHEETDVDENEKTTIDNSDNSEENNDVEDNEKGIPLTDQEKVQRLEQILSSAITEKLNSDVFVQLMKTSKDDREQGLKLLTKSLTEILTKGVRKESVDSAKSRVEQDINLSSLHVKFKESLIQLSNFAIVENSFFDPEATIEAQKEAVSSVEPVVIRAGEIIVREEQIITNQIYEELKLAGLLSKERSIYPVIGLIIFIFLILCMIGYEMNVIHLEKRLDKGKVVSILVISIIVASLMKIVSLYTTQTNHLYFVVPIATGALLLKLLINERTAIVLSFLYAIIGCIIFNGEIPGSLNIEAGIYFFFSQVAAIVFLSNVKDRLAIVRAGLGMTVVNMLTVLLFVFLLFDKYSIMSLLILLSFAVVSALLSAVLTSGFLPFFETSLGILSDIKLLSLSNPNHPLLRKLLLEAPGTYHHSIMVANLSEIACEEIGANGLLARVGSYYHDIGKTVRPHYFIENQVAMQNPHDLIEPRESAEIILGHPYDGADLLKKHKMPRELIDIAEQHHGTTLLKYFYFKEKKKNEDVKETDFRYPGPRPQTKEAAIICICDSVEAAVRSLKEPTEEKIDEIVSSIINDRLMDDQLDESPLTLKELNSIHVTVCETLKGIFHSRIQYPQEEEAN